MRFLVAAVVAAVIDAGAVQAQVAVPAEFPPSSFTGNQFIDSTGCAFIRAGISGIVSWVPRVDRNREQLCGFQPTFPGGAPIEVMATEGLIINIPQAPAAPVAATAPIQTVASLPLFSPAPTPAPTPEVTPSAPAAPTMTRATLCEGKYGVQPGYVSSRTGLPIDCGAAPVAAPVVVAASATPSMTLAQACTLMSETGRRLTNVQTGQLVRCGPQTQPIVSAAPVTAPYVAPVVAPTVVTAPAPTSSCPGLSAVSARYLVGADVRCGPQSQSPSAGNASSSKALVLGAAPPFSNPPAGTPVPAAPPEGYAAVWDDGRVNPNRGLPAHRVAALQAQATHTSAKAVAPVASAARYVQVGSFADPSNAQALAHQFAASGISANIGRLTRSNGAVLNIVLLGPFAQTTDLTRALSAARSSGFSDAFVRG